MHVKNGNAIVKLLIVLVILAAGVFAALHTLRDTVVVAEVKRSKAVDLVPGSVEVFADKDLQQLRIDGAGRVAWCEPLNEGNQFKKGDVLLRLDTTEADRAFAEAQRVYDQFKEQAKINAERSSEKIVAEKAVEDAKRLFQQGGVSKDDVDRAERTLASVLTQLDLTNFALKKAEADFKVADEAHKLQLKKMQVVAPSDGQVAGVLVAVDSLVTQGASVATFYANERIVVAKISEEDFAKVKLDAPARVQLLSYPDQNFDAKVTKILPFADPETRRYKVHLKVDAPLERLLPNSTGEVSITVGEHDNVPVIPRQALFNGNFVYVVKDGRLEKRAVVLGFKGLNLAEVAKGIAPGELVVVENQDMLRDGQRVRLAE
jgi:RND family efflux transporter MFP subunit